MLEDDAARAVFMDSAVFGQATLYDPQDGAEVAVLGIFTAAHARRAEAAGLAVSTAEPVLTVFAADLPAGALLRRGDGDAVTINATRYSVRDIEPDGSGLARIVLERA
ncbi:MAG: hypothetical protein ACK4WC_15925 [Rubrimonas sp.]